MIINNQNAYRSLISIIGIIVIGLAVTLIVTSFMSYKTRDNRTQLQGTTIPGEGEKPQKIEYQDIEQAETIKTTTSSLEGFLPPADTNVPPPVKSIKTNEIIENLLYALKFYSHVPEGDELISSVDGWDAETGYNVLDISNPGSQITAMARSVRFFLLLKLYQMYFPATRYFDDEAQRLDAIVDRMIEPQNLDTVVTNETFFIARFPYSVFYDLLWLADLTGDDKYRNAALAIGDKNTRLITMQTNLIKDNMDRSNKVIYFNNAAMGYITGKETGNLNLMKDSELLFEELIDELWDDSYNLFYTDASIGATGNITLTFITNNQVHAALSLIRYAEASGNKQAENIATTILKSMSDGTNPVCDKQSPGFFRRYYGETGSPHKDFKVADDHLTYLYAWVKLNELNNGLYNESLNVDYETYEIYMYDRKYNAIYHKYTQSWRPHPSVGDTPLVFSDSMLKFLLLTFEDRTFRAEKKLEG